MIILKICILAIPSQDLSNKIHIVFVKPLFFRQKLHFFNKNFSSSTREMVSLARTRKRIKKKLQRGREKHFGKNSCGVLRRDYLHLYFFIDLKLIVISIKIDY